MISALKHPATLGTGIGGLGGAGIGYLSADRNDPHLLRKMLVGGATGAAIGGLTGGLASAGRGAKDMPSPEDFRKAMDGQFKAGVERGATSGAKSVFDNLKSNPADVAEVLREMDPEKREAVLRQFKKGWLARMFGG